MSAFRVRRAEPEDLEAILRIWKAGIELSLGGPPAETIDYAAYFRTRIAEQDDVFRFFLVEDEQKRLLAWQSLMPFRSNPAVRGSMAEISLYTDPSKPNGGSTLAGLNEMFAHADRSPLLFLLAVIADTNRGAINLTHTFGLTHVGAIPTTDKAPHLPSLGLYLYTCKK